MKVISKQTNSKMCLICGKENLLGVHTRFYNMENGSVCALFAFKKEHQSYPKRVHGGMICALLDELAGRSLWVESPESLGVTATLKVKFRKPVPYDEELVAVGKMVKRSGKIFIATAKIMTKEKVVLAESEGSYVILSNEKIMADSLAKKEKYDIFIPDNVTEIDI